MSEKTIRIATRKSQLALTQTGQVADLLRRRNPHMRFELVTVQTLGDRDTVKPLSQFRGMGVFVKELEELLLNGSADLAVHSLKDVPAEVAPGLLLASFPTRADPADVLLTRGEYSLSNLPRNARLGTSSPRRSIQLRAVRPDLEYCELRGNLDTRIRKLNNGDYDAIVVAAAGMIRLGIPFDRNAVLPFDVCLPAIGQGALVIECRDGDADALITARSVNDPVTEKAVRAERILMKTVGASCSVPVAALARITHQTMTLQAMAGDPATGSLVGLCITASIEESERAAIMLGERLLDTCAQKGIVIGPAESSRLPSDSTGNITS
jgi:hydroxymethylbilane synthase